MISGDGYPPDLIGSKAEMTLKHNKSPISTQSSIRTTIKFEIFHFQRSVWTTVFLRTNPGKNYFSWSSWICIVRSAEFHIYINIYFLWFKTNFFHLLSLIHFLRESEKVHQIFLYTPIMKINFLWFQKISSHWFLWSRRFFSIFTVFIITA